MTSAIFIIMADTQQKINRVVVDLIKVISPPLKCRAYFSAYLILVHCSICCKNAGGIDSWAIKTFRRRLWKRKVKALLYYLNGAEVFNQIAGLVHSMERFYELSWLLFVFLNVRIWRRIWIELIRNFTVISAAPQQHVLFTVSHFHAVNWEFLFYFFFFFTSYLFSCSCTSDRNWDNDTTHQCTHTVTFHASLSPPSGVFLTASNAHIQI